MNEIDVLRERWNQCLGTWSAKQVARACLGYHVRGETAAAVYALGLDDHRRIAIIADIGPAAIVRAAIPVRRRELNFGTAAINPHERHFGLQLERTGIPVFWKAAVSGWQAQTFADIVGLVMRRHLIHRGEPTLLESLLKFAAGTPPVCCPAAVALLMAINELLCVHDCPDLLAPST